MTKFIAFCEKRSTKDLLPPPQFHAFGDWLSIKADTPKETAKAETAKAEAKAETAKASSLKTDAAKN